MEKRIENEELRAFVNRNFKREFLVENLLPDNDTTDNKVAVLYGKAQAGKSQLAMQLAVSVACNIPFLCDKRYRINNAQKRPVLYIALEGGENVTNEIKRRQLIGFLDKGYNVDDFKKVEIVADDSIIKDYDPETASFYTLEKKIKEINPCLVIYDNISNIASILGESLSTQRGINSVVMPFQELAKKYNFVNLFISHPTKRTKEDEVYEMAGGHTLVDFSHTILRLSKIEGKRPNRLNLKIAKTNILENAKSNIRVVKDAENLICEVEE